MCLVDLDGIRKSKIKISLFLRATILTIHDHHNYLVLGASGFIGQNLCQSLLQQKLQVTAFSRSKPNNPLLDECNWITGDFREINQFSFMFDGVDYVIHLISTMNPANSNKDPERDVTENLIGTLRLMEICKVKQIKRLIILSSGGTVYGPNVSTPTTERELCNPKCSYGIVKLAIEKYATLYRKIDGLDSVILRVSNPYGAHQVSKGQGFIAEVIQKALRNEVIKVWGDGSAVRDYIHVSDVVNAIFAAMKLDNPQAPHIFNIGSGCGRSINQVLSSINEIHQLQPLKVIKENERLVDLPISLLDISLAKFFLNWSPSMPWYQGLELTYQWAQKNTIISLKSDKSKK